MNVGKRVVFIGDSQVGKTSIINAFIKKEFIEQNPTIGASFYTHMMNYDDKQVYLQIWDTAGQEKFRSIGPIYFRKALAAVAVFDLTSKESLNNLKSWIELFRNNSDDNFVIVVGNKQDLESSIVFDPDETSKWAKSMNAECVWASAKTGYGVEDIFNMLAEHLSKVQSPEKKETVTINEEQCNPPKEKSCCA